MPYLVAVAVAILVLDDDQPWNVLLILIKFGAYLRPSMTLPLRAGQIAEAQPHLGRAIAVAAPTTEGHVDTGAKIKGGTRKQDSPGYVRKSASKKQPKTSQGTHWGARNKHEAWRPGRTLTKPYKET